MYKAIEHCRDLLENFGGHTYAAGLSMKIENVPEFTRRFEQYVTDHILPEQTSATIDIDAQLDFRDITPKFFFDLKKRREPSLNFSRSMSSLSQVPHSGKVLIIQDSLVISLILLITVFLSAPVFGRVF